jgi:hypothetical protein
MRVGGIRENIPHWISRGKDRAVRNGVKEK